MRYGAKTAAAEKPALPSFKSALPDLSAKLIGQIHATLTVIKTTDGKIKLISDEQSKLALAQSNILEVVRDLQAQAKTTSISDEVFQSRVEKTMKVSVEEYRALQDRLDRQEAKLDAIAELITTRFDSSDALLRSQSSAILPASIDATAFERRVQEVMNFLKESAAKNEVKALPSIVITECKASAAYEAGVVELLQSFTEIAEVKNAITSLSDVSERPPPPFGLSFPLRAASC